MKKKSLKKVTSAVLVAAMSMGLLAGCGGSKSSGEAKTDADGATVIKFGIHVANPKKQETVTYNIVQGFNKENKGKYKVEFVAADTEAHSKNMKLAAQDGSLPEIVHLDSAEAPKYNEAGYLLDMSDFLKENKDIDDALDGMEDAFNDGKVQYGLPYQSNVQGFFYNKDLFDKAGIAYPTDDTTYDEFLDMIAKLKDSGVTPIAIGSKNSGYSMWEFNEFFSRYGWEDNEKSYTGDKAKYSNDDMNACFEKIKGLADAGAFPENMATIEYFDAKQLFNEGKAAMFGTGQWDCAEFDKNIGEHIGFWWGPKFEDSSYEQNIAMKVPAAPLVVSSAVKDNDKAKEAVYAFLKYYYGEEAAKISYEGSIFPATNYDGIAATDSQYASDTDGFQVSYRFHITDPVRFEKHLKVTIEHGHANHLSDDWSSTAYWYQTLPTAKPITILPVEERIPNVPVLPERNLQMPELTEEMKEARESWAKRWEEYKPAREEQFRIKENKARRESKLNTEFAKKLREEYK